MFKDPHKNPLPEARSPQLGHARPYPLLFPPSPFRSLYPSPPHRPPSIIRRPSSLVSRPPSPLQSPLSPSPTPTLVSKNVSSPQHHFRLIISVSAIIPPEFTHQTPHVPPLFPKKLFPPHPPFASFAPFATFAVQNPPCPSSIIYRPSAVISRPPPTIAIHTLAYGRVKQPVRRRSLLCPGLRDAIIEPCSSDGWMVSCLRCCGLAIGWFARRTVDEDYL